MAAKARENPNACELRREDILKTGGGSRAVASGMYSLIFSFASTAVLWLFIVAGSGFNAEVAYFGENGFVNGIVGIVGAGFSQAYIAQVKENVIKDPKKAVQVASTYTRFLILYGIIAAIICLILSFVIPPAPPSPDNKNIPLLLQNSLLLSVPQILLNYCVLSPMFWSLQVVNRYDITSFVGALGGGGSLGFGFLFLALHVPPEFFAFLGTINALLNVPLISIFFRRHSPFRFKALWTTSPLLQDKKKTVEILRYAGLTTFSNMESFQLISNVNMITTSFALQYFYPSGQEWGTSLLVTINIYSQIKCSLNLFSSPLNVELAEAYCRGDRQKMKEIISHTVKFSYFVGFALIVGFCGLAAVILRFLHTASFTAKGTLPFDETLFQLAIFIAIFMSLGQAGFGVANLFANALIGTEKAAVSAKVYVIALIISAVLTPVLIIVFDLGLAGIAWSTLLVGIATGAVMQHEVKKHLQIQLETHFLNMVPMFSILFVIIFFFPYGAITGTVFGDIAIAIAIIVPFYIFSLSFFGVFHDEDDWVVLRDMYVSLGLRRVANRMVNMGKFLYRLNPFHRRNNKEGNQKEH